ncbi:hypothetical protein OYT88_06155 [Sporolactobacillus sp. CQH2019]|uniref:hypothetical protein n=1 Tax=Sporolactobacillus sp. CQH2019 TaxID=3023512 RepID=UPI0023677C76|nr:hypothetical protein [Sporolactobacillus sp. CQH2019]MDD9148129.1 hypothetical protein [Sporolactobacillus sp. CQH2019]
MRAVRRIKTIRVVLSDTPVPTIRRVATVSPETAVQLYWFFQGVQDHAVAKHRMQMARWALRMKSKYFRAMKKGQ